MEKKKCSEPKKEKKKKMFLLFFLWLRQAKVMSKMRASSAIIQCGELQCLCVYGFSAISSWYLLFFVSILFLALVLW